MFKKLNEAVLKQDGKYGVGDVIYVSPKSVSTVRWYNRDVSKIKMDNGEEFLVIGHASDVIDFLGSNTVQNVKIELKTEELR